MKFLQMTVVPYMTVSLITALGALRTGDIGTIAVKGGAILLPAQLRWSVVRNVLRWVR